MGRSPLPARPLTEILIKPGAEADIRDAVDWYAGQRPGLDAEFLEALTYCFEVLRSHPLAYEAVHGPIRRGLLRRFPYGVFYVVESDRVVVLAVYHASREPEGWQQRLEP